MAASRGYRSGRSYYVFLSRDGHAFRIQASDERVSAIERERRFRKFIGSFAARKQFDVPNQPGVCIPHGFIPDDGQGDYQTTMSMRQADRPGVIYTIDTGLLSENGYATRPQPGALKAFAVGSIDVLAGSVTEGRVEKSIGPRGAKIGPLSASQGGVSLNTAEEGKPKVPSYSVYTAYDGQMNVQALPFIVVEMRSWTSEQVPDLKQNPPPLNESMDRLDALIDGTWLRPIDTGVPELQGKQASLSDG
ncbi:hypothetical protein LC55x_2675 [Lysobacter capsici]|uniref:T6SS immunity protein Tli4 family protein n=1 Tax=Lysobacter capsici TaxID=435897 RepID=UPI0007165883|nr:T6SS immunity protein Tli4 family protein [Lysobacter capsici]ALN85940.1 hypothetical protein LC55x_2675 [Lysobacter capsici]